MGRRRTASLDEVIARGIVRSEALAKGACRDIRGDIMRLSRDLDIHSKAADRAKVEKAIRARIRRLESMLEQAQQAVIGTAVSDANGDAGLEVSHSSAYTREILGMVQDSQGQNLAGVFSRRMAQSVIDGLRRATVSTIQEASVLGLSLREQKNLIRQKWEDSCARLEDAVFVDSSGHEWKARDYFTMNVRTNAMRVYNDVLAGNIASEGNDLAQITRHGDPHCARCFPWEGRIVSITGKTKDYPTYEQARAAGCFHPNCTHRLETVNEIADADEIELQRGLKAPDEGGDPMKNAFEADVAMLERSGLDHDDAVLEAKRERVRLAIQNGIPDGKSARIADNMTEHDISMLTNGWKVPRFNVAKRGESVGWNNGARGGRIVLPRDDVTLEAIRRILKRRK